MPIKKEIADIFKGKKITVLGLGLLGRGLGDTKFLAECGADLIVTDLKNEEQLKTSIDQLKKFKIKFVLGEHRLEDFRNRDFILKAAGVPLNSPFIEEARKNNIPIKMSASWLAELSPATIIGVTGTRGKSTTTHLIYEILNQHSMLAKSRGKVYLGGNVKGVATLPLLAKVKANDLVVMELDSWQLQGFGEAKVSPHISVFTNLMVDHQNYYGPISATAGKTGMELYFADKSNIFANQKKDDLLIVSGEAKRVIRDTYREVIKSQIIVATAVDVPKNWKIKIIGQHNLTNVALAVQVARLLGVDDKLIKKVVEAYKGVPGRLELVREVKGVKYYNDTTATTPDGVMAALTALGGGVRKKIILLAGGADKMLEYKKMGQAIDREIKSLVLFKGAASDKIIATLPKRHDYFIYVVDNMKDAIRHALDLAEKGDIVLLSPGAASFGIFKNEFDRGEQFNKIIKSLK